MEDGSRRASNPPAEPEDKSSMYESAVDWAEIAAMLGDFREAVEWLDIAESISGELPVDMAARRRSWRLRAGPDESPGVH
jgi:hypothetical protein